ncbi:hypothetical protein [Dyella sp. C11]|uniref:hypothetical protein n=1 Tax=Dyella sp. C11 TaxID=2126991 RepID=UPI0013001E82|nr:hypothetical protein [Dyella sp. C11]
MPRIAWIVWFLASMLFSSTAASAGSRQGCAPLQGFEATASAQVVIFGDFHGTEQPPAIFANAACLFARDLGDARGVIGIELPESFNAYFDQVTPENREALWTRIQADPFWDEFKDGRHGAAMLEMVRALLDVTTASPGRIRLLAVARQPIDAEGASLFVETMKSFDARRGLVFIGNAHARLMGMPGMQGSPFAANVKGSGLTVISLNIKPGKGTGWFCTPQCASKRLPVFSPEGDDVHVVMDSPATREPWDGYYYVPELTLSHAVRKATP